MFTEKDCPEYDNLGSIKKARLQYRNPEKDYLGCFSSCGYLVKGGAYRDGMVNDKVPYQGNDGHPNAKMYCCPGDKVTSKQCNEGPVNKTQYCKSIHKVCKKVHTDTPAVYCQAYDDKWGLGAVNTKGAKFKVVFYDDSFKNYGIK